MNLRRFAETPVVRRAINVIKDRIAAMDWQVRVRRGVAAGEVTARRSRRKLRALRRMLEEPNAVDSFRTLIEQVIEDALTGGFGAIEMEPTGDAERPAMLWAVDGASIRINAAWDGQPESPRYAQALPGQLESSAVELLRRPADVCADESAQLYALWAGAAGGGVRDGEPVSERAPVRGQAGGELGGAVCAVAERGDARAARPADSLVAGRDRRHGARAAALDRAEAGGAALCAGHGCGSAAGVAGVSDPHGGQCIWLAADDAGAGRRT